MYPSKSVHEMLEGPFNFDQQLMAPPRTKAIIYEAATKQAYWAQLGTDAYYLSPAFAHY